MRWNEFHDTAEWLAQGTTEGDWRSAISRGYYGVFHFFREFLAAHGLNLPRGSQPHFLLYSGLANCGLPMLASIASRLDDLREERGWADYELHRVIGPLRAVTLVQESRALIADFQRILLTLPPAQIVAAVRRYWQSTGRLGPIP